jgi:hypothetical protein
MRRKFSLFNTLGILCFLLLPLRVARAEVNEIGARGAAIDFVRTEMGFSSSHQLRATRREDWEDDLFRLQVKIKGQIAKAAYFFMITEEGYFVLSPDEAVLVNSTDGKRLWTVAVAVKDGAPYGLHGFSDGEAEFARLVNGARLQVRSDTEAEVAALLFFTTVKDPQSHTIVFRSSELRHKIEDYFLSKMPEQKAESRATTWWRGFTAAKLAGQIGVRSAETSDGYVVSITLIRAENSDRLKLARLRLRVNATGAPEALDTAVVYGPAE